MANGNNQRATEKKPSPPTPLKIFQKSSWGTWARAATSYHFVRHRDCHHAPQVAGLQSTKLHLLYRSVKLSRFGSVNLSHLLAAVRWNLGFL